MNSEGGSEGWRIIGVGSPVVGDDLGWAAIQALEEAGLDHMAELLPLDRPGPALLDYLQGRSRVILIDAMQAGLAPGSVRALSPAELIASAHPPSSHDLGLAETLALARALGCIPARLHVIGVETSPVLDGGMRSDALREVVRLVQSVLSGHGSGLETFVPGRTGSSQRAP
ncbi:MAG: hydrogenase maturation protease [Thioalkalivibrio sp.]|nr:hydrogenase maturation protease [Thioalkalivibrio sp.]